MMKEIRLNGIVKVFVVLIVATVVFAFGSSTSVEAKSKIRLSVKEKTVMEGQSFTLSLKGVSSKVKTGKLK